jgi:hypothetical protein
VHVMHLGRNCSVRTGRAVNGAPTVILHLPRC